MSARESIDDTLARQTCTAWLICSALLVLLLAPGCRSTRDNQIDILERELRAQEDYIYELEDYVVEYSDKLRQCRCTEPHSFSVVSETPASASPASSRSSAPTPSTPAASSRSTLSKPTVSKAAAPQGSPPASKAPTPASQDRAPVKPLAEPEEDSYEESPLPANEPQTPMEELEAPELELEIGEPIGLDEEEFEQLADTELAAEDHVDVSLIPDPATYQTSAVQEFGDLENFAGEKFAAAEDYPFEEEETTEANAENQPADDQSPPVRRQAEQLVIKHVFRDSLGTPQPSSLLSVIEARDSRNEPADFDGKVSLMIMEGDPNQPQRIKRWDFTAEETAAAWQTSQLGDGLHLELPLEVSQLPVTPCELWVRLETADGRKLLSQMPLDASSLVSLEDSSATNEQLVSDEQAAEEEVVELNPLRAGGKQIAVRATPLAKDQSPPATVARTKAEPQWRAATHFSSGENAGFATTATGEQWTPRPIPDRPAPGERPASSTATKHRWTSRK